jgi:hypothetical protein
MSVPQKAATLEAAYRILEPRPLEADELPFYHFRGRKRAGLWKIDIWLSTGDSKLAGKWLVTGHKGIGKTTELRYLLNKFRETHLPVLIDAAEELNLGSLEALDLLLLVGKRFYEESQDYISADETKRAIDDLVSFIIKETRSVRNDLAKDLDNISLSKGDVLLNVLRDFVLRLGGKSSDEERTSLRSQLGAFYPTLVEKLNHLLRLISGDIPPRVLISGDTEPRVPVIAIDGLDRLAPAIARDLFLKEEMLRQLDCKAIYTFPLSLRYSPDFNQLCQSFENQQTALLNYTTFTREGQPYEPGRVALREMVLRRIDPVLIEPAALERLVDLSGGIPRELFYLARDACTFALLDEAAFISLEHIDQAAQEYGSVFSRMLTEADLAELCHVYRGDHRVLSSSQRDILTYKGALLEYENGHSWCNAHPVLHPVLETACQDDPQTEAMPGGAQ